MSGKIEYIPEQLIAATPGNPGAGYVKLYRKADGLFYELDSAGNENIANWHILKPNVITAPGIVIHNGGANTDTVVTNQNITYPIDGDYIATLSFNWNIDGTTANAKFYATVGGNAIDLNDRAADPQGNNQIMVARIRNAGNTSSGAITGTGSGFKMPYMSQFILTGKTVGTEAFELRVGNQTGGVNTAVWNVILRIEPLNIP